MAKYKVKAMYFPNGPKLIHKSGEILEDSKIVGGPARIEQAIKDGFITLVKDK